MYSVKSFLLIFMVMSVHFMATGQKTDTPKKTPYKEQKAVPGMRVDTLDYSYLKFDTVYKFYRSKGIDLVQADNPDLLFEVYDWLNSPYCWGGRSKKGTDCAGFVNSMINKLYSKNFGGSAIDIFKKCDTVSPTDMHEGDLVFFNISGKYLSHVGIYLQNGRFAHAASHGGVIVSSLEDKYYKRWFYRAGRVKNE